MCVISYQHQFLMIHVPKTAGKSVSRMLGQYSHNPHQYWVNRTLTRLGLRSHTLGPYWLKNFRSHATVNDIKKHLPTEIFDSLYKFAFVRNPWDALVSQYHFVRETSFNKRHKTVKNMTFEQFLHWWLEKPKKGRQKHYVADNQGKCLVDFIGRFESLVDDCNYVLRKLNLAGELTHIGPSKHRDYRSYYSDDLAEYLEKKLAADISYFGYKFDGIASDPPHFQRTLSVTNQAA